MYKPKVFQVNQKESQLDWHSFSAQIPYDGKGGLTQNTAHLDDPFAKGSKLSSLGAQEQNLSKLKNLQWERKM